MGSVVEIEIIFPPTRFTLSIVLVRSNLLKRSDYITRSFEIPAGGCFAAVSLPLNIPNHDHHHRCLWPLCEFGVLQAFDA